MWAALVLLWVVRPGSAVCYSSFGIMHSAEECVFHYAADGPACDDYRFTHCEYYTNTTTYWLWIFRDDIRSHLVSSPALPDCAAVCCKDNGTLPLGVEGHRLCQERKFAREVVETEFLEVVVQLGMAMFLISIVTSILYAIYQTVEHYLLELRAEPREI
jgi:hypothetical protein